MPELMLTAILLIAFTIVLGSAEGATTAWLGYGIGVLGLALLFFSSYYIG